MFSIHNKIIFLDFYLKKFETRFEYFEHIIEAKIESIKVEFEKQEILLQQALDLFQDRLISKSKAFKVTKRKRIQICGNHRFLKKEIIGNFDDSSVFNANRDEKFLMFCKKCFYC